MSESDDRYTGESARLLFVPIGRELVDALDMAEALARAVHGVPAIDVSFRYNDTGEFQIEQPSWQDDSMSGGQQIVLGYQAIHVALGEQRLMAYTSDGSKTYRISRMYWWRVPSFHEFLAKDVGVPDNLVGMPILIDRADIGGWREVVDNAALPAPPIDGQAKTADADQACLPRGPRLSGRWENRVPTPQAVLVFKFFKTAKRHLAGGSAPLNSTELRKEYVGWLGKPEQSRKPGQAHPPYVRSSFEAKLALYEDGWRIKPDGKGLEYSPD